jgi:hypothetical protein
MMLIRGRSRGTATGSPVIRGGAHAERRTSLTEATYCNAEWRLPGILTGIGGTIIIERPPAGAVQLLARQWCGDATPSASRCGYATRRYLPIPEVLRPGLPV